MAIANSPHEQPLVESLSMATPLYSYDADTQHAKVYHRTTGAVVCEVRGVDLYVGNLLSRLADEMYKDGFDAGRRSAIGDMQTQIDCMLRRS